MARRALVTGFTGYVGGQVAAALVRAGWEVHAPVRGEVMEGRRGVAVREHRVEASYASVAEVVGRVRADVVFHVAGAVVVEHGPDQVETLIGSNVLFPTWLVEAMVAAGGGARLVNTGTSWEHFDATDRYDPVNLYAATKRAFEDICVYYVSAGRLDVVTLKLFDVYGPDDGRSKIVPLLLRLSRSGETLRMSGGEQRMDMIHVDDVAGAYGAAAAMLVGGFRGAAGFAVRTGRVMSLREIVGVFERALGRGLPIEWGGRAYRDREVFTPWGSMEGVPGWGARVGLEEGLAGVIAAYGRSLPAVSAEPG